jgi:hypothetical protein
VQVETKRHLELQKTKHEMKLIECHFFSKSVEITCYSTRTHEQGWGRDLRSSTTTPCILGSNILIYPLKINLHYLLSLFKFMHCHAYNAFKVHIIGECLLVMLLGFIILMNFSFNPLCLMLRLAITWIL